MKGVRTIAADELDSMVSGMDRKPYLLIVASNSRSRSLAESEGVQALGEFNQREMIKERTPVFVLKDPSSFRPSWRGFMWVFTIRSMRELNPAIAEVVQMHNVV
jgi:hypothetical protein